MMMAEWAGGGADGGGPTSDLDLRGIGRAILRRRAWITAATLGALLVACAILAFTPKRFTGEAKLLVENQESYFTRPDVSDRDIVVSPDPEAVQSQVQLVTSRDLARRAIATFEANNRIDLDPVARGLNPLQRVLILVGAVRDPAATAAEDRRLETYFERLTAFSVPRTRVVTIEFSAENPDFAADGANKIADAYITLQSDAKRSAARAAGASLSPLIATLRTRLAEAEARAEEFRARSGLLAVQKDTTITAQQLADLNAELSRARGAQAEAQAKARLIRDMIRQNRIAEIPGVSANDLVRRVADQQSSVRAQLALESRTLLDGHPRIKELQAQLASLDAQLRAAAEKAVRTLENDARIAASRVDNLTASLEAQKKTAGLANADEVQLRALEGEARQIKAELETNVTKYQNALVRESAPSTPADARIISRAVAPSSPTFPKPVPLVAFATLSGLLLSVGAAVAGALLSGDAPVAAPEPIRARAEPAPMTTAPLVEPARATPEVRVAAPPQPDVINDIARRIGQSEAGDYAVRVLVTASEPGRSAKSAALTLARALSHERRAVLVDLDAAEFDADRLAAPRARALGLGDLMAGAASFAEVIHRDDHSRLHRIGAGALDLTHMDGFDDTLDALARTYHYVVLNAPAVSATPAALAIAPVAEFCVLVAAGKGDEAAFAHARDALQTTAVGEVLTIGREAAARTLAA